MKGNLFIAVQAQPEAGRQSDRQTGKGRRQNKPSEVEERKIKKIGGQNRWMLLTLAQPEPGEDMN